MISTGPHKIKIFLGPLADISAQGSLMMATVIRPGRQGQSIRNRELPLRSTICNPVLILLSGTTPEEEAAMTEKQLQ